MKRLLKPRRDLSLDRMFETRSDAWAAVGLDFEVNTREVKRARRWLGVELIALALVVFGKVRVDDHFVLVAAAAAAHRHHRHVQQAADWYLPHAAFTAIAVAAVLILGWLISRDLGRITPALFRRMDPSTAGPVEFLVRLAVVAATAMGAMAMAGISFHALLVGGAFTAVVLGLAAQQTLGNLFAGMVLLTARPFKLGERIRLQAGAVAGSAEGIVSQQGLLYTTLARGDDRIMVPNNVVLAAVVVPLREPEAVDVKVSLNSGVRPTHVQAILDKEVRTPTRTPPNVLLEEIDGDKVVIRVQATPALPADGAQLADEIIAALAGVTGEHELAAVRRGLEQQGKLDRVDQDGVEPATQEHRSPSAEDSEPSEGRQQVAPAGKRKSSRAARER